MASATERTPDTERDDSRPTQPPPADGAESAAIRGAMEDWEQGELARVLERFPEREPKFRSSSAETQRVYTPLDTPGLDYLRDIGVKGQMNISNIAARQELRDLVKALRLPGVSVDF